MNKPNGIRERILSAKSPEEVKQLLDEMRGYDFISAKTLQACLNASRKRLKQLLDGKEDVNV